MLRLALLFVGAAVSEGLQMGAAPLAAKGLSVAPLARTAAVSMQFGKQKKSAAELLEEKGYWPGEWVCADCGYIYEPGTTPAFEELRPRWKCPQCAGPRRRFVKKAGGVTASVDDSPLVLGTAFFALFTAGLVYFGLTV